MAVQFLGVRITSLQLVLMTDWKRTAVPPPLVGDVLLYINVSGRANILGKSRSKFETSLDNSSYICRNRYALQ